MFGRVYDPFRRSAGGGWARLAFPSLKTFLSFWYSFGYWNSALLWLWSVFEVWNVENLFKKKIIVPGAIAQPLFHEICITTLELAVQVATLLAGFCLGPTNFISYLCTCQLVRGFTLSAHGATDIKIPFFRLLPSGLLFRPPSSTAGYKGSCFSLIVGWREFYFRSCTLKSRSKVFIPLVVFSINLSLIISVTCISLLYTYIYIYIF